MTFFKGAFTALQRIGKALMLPVSVLPVAGLMLGIGAAGFDFLPAIVSSVMARAGGAVFGNLPLIFAVGVALGFTENDGVAALAAVVGYTVLLGSMGVVAKACNVPVEPIMGIETVDTGVIGGILVGVVAANAHRRYRRIELPTYLAFFAGERFVPIATALSAVVLGFALSVAWPPVGRGMHAFSTWAAHENPAFAFALYGFGERALLPFGLHHLWNVPFLFEVGSFQTAHGEVVRGELHRFLAGDPTAGNLAGGYLLKMWGLPAAALAIWHSARPDQRARVGGIMISAALTSFLTGVTEPIEFAFMFVAPMLYGLHAVLTGFAFLICISLGLKHGPSFSHGLIDYLLLFQKAQRPWAFLLLGPLWAGLYYAVFRVTIERFDLATPGRERRARVEELGPEPAELAQKLSAREG